MHRMYAGIEKANKCKSSFKLLICESEVFPVQPYSILDILDLASLSPFEPKIIKFFSSIPPLYRPYMEEVRQQLQKRTVLLN